MYELDAPLCVSLVCGVEVWSESEYRSREPGRDHGSDCTACGRCAETSREQYIAEHRRQLARRPGSRGRWGNCGRGTGVSAQTGGSYSSHVRPTALAILRICDTHGQRAGMGRGGAGGGAAGDGTRGHAATVGVGGDVFHRWDDLTFRDPPSRDSAPASSDPRPRPQLPLALLFPLLAHVLTRLSRGLPKPHRPLSATLPQILPFRHERLSIIICPFRTGGASRNRPIQSLCPVAFCPG